jgi:hypothetical protein
MATTSERLAEIDRELGAFGKSDADIDRVRDRARASSLSLEEVDRELASLSNGTERISIPERISFSDRISEPVAIPDTRTHTQPPKPPPPRPSAMRPPATTPSDPMPPVPRAETKPHGELPPPEIASARPPIPEPPPPRAPVFRRSTLPETPPVSPRKSKTPGPRSPFDEIDETLPGHAFPPPVATTKNDPRLSAFDLFEDDFGSSPPSAAGPTENSSVEIANLLDDHLADSLATDQPGGELSERLEAEIDLPAPEATEVFAAPNFAAIEKKLLDEADDVKDSLMRSVIDPDDDDIEVVVDDFDVVENTDSDVPKYLAPPPSSAPVASGSSAPKSASTMPEAPEGDEDADAPKKGGFFKKLFGG